MNWLANYMGVKSAPPPHHSEDDDESAPSNPREETARKTRGIARKREEPIVHRGYNWRNRHGQREVGELRP